MRKIGLVLAVLLALVLAGCGANPGAGAAKVVSLTPAEVQQRLESGDKVVVLDVREDYEFKEGRIPGAKLIPLGVLDQRRNELNKNDQIIVVCRSGNRSAQGADLLVKSGFKQVYNMTGGMNQWKGKVEK